MSSEGKTIYLMRHGETLFNVEKRIQGACDSPLTAKGQAQATAMGRLLAERGVHLDSAYSSTSERAVDTRQLVLEAMGQTAVPQHQLKTLKECSFGSFEGMPEYLNPPLPYNEFFVQYGGESTAQVEARITQAVTNIAEHDCGNNILIVSHAGACRGFIQRCVPAAYDIVGPHMPNSTVLQVTYTNHYFDLQQVISL